MKTYFADWCVGATAGMTMMHSRTPIMWNLQGHQKKMNHGVALRNPQPKNCNSSHRSVMWNPRRSHTEPTKKPYLKDVTLHPGFSGLTVLIWCASVTHERRRAGLQLVHGVCEVQQHKQPQPAVAARLSIHLCLTRSLSTNSIHQGMRARRATSVCGVNEPQQHPSRNEG